MRRRSTYVDDPERLSAGTAVRQVQLALAAGVLYLDGGWETLVTALRATGESAGAALVTGARVTGVAHEAGRVRGVRLADGSRRDARAVVLATDAPTAATLLGETADPALAAFARAAVPVAAACLDVGLAVLPLPRSTFALGIDRPVYLSVHSAVARLAPEGAALVQVAKYLAPDAVQDAAADERELDALLDLVQPGWRSHLLHRRFLPHPTVVTAVPTAATGGLRGRPDVTTRVAGAYLAGDWVGSEGLLADASLASGVRAAEAVPAELEASARTAAA